MITWFRTVVVRVIKQFFFDPLAFVRWMRGLTLAVAAGGAAFADAIADILGEPGWVKAIKIIAVICAFIAGAITAGEKNPTDAGTTAAVDRDLATVGERKVVEAGPVVPPEADPLSNPPRSP